MTMLLVSLILNFLIFMIPLKLLFHNKFKPSKPSLNHGRSYTKYEWASDQFFLSQIKKRLK